MLDSLGEPRVARVIITVTVIPRGVTVTADEIAPVQCVNVHAGRFEMGRLGLGCHVPSLPLATVTHTHPKVLKLIEVTMKVLAQTTGLEAVKGNG